MRRREFLLSSGAALVAANATAFADSQLSVGADLDPTDFGSKAAAARIPKVINAGTMRGEMLYRPLGRTGIEVSVIGLGDSHLGQATVSEDDAIRLIHEGLDRGITFLDNSWDYNEGQSEMRVGKALSQSGYRQKAFVMTKIDGRTKEVAAAQIETSLTRLQTDHIDLLQHHEVLRFDDPDRIFGKGGSMEAVLEARRAGKVRFIGFTGHKDPRIHLYMLEVARQNGFHFDTVQMRINIMDAHLRSFSQLVVPRATGENIGVLGMKCFGSGVIPKSNAVQPMDCLHYSLNIPLSVLITGINTRELLDQAFTAVKTFSQ